MTSTVQHVSNNVRAKQRQPNYVDLNDLASDQVGGRILFATDEWLGAADNLLKAETPEWKEGIFTKFGKWMDGWETRRKRTEGYDWCIVEFGKPGVIYGFDVDTAYFTGSYAPRCSIQAACLHDKFPGRPAKDDCTGTCANEEQQQAVSQLNSENWEFLVSLSELKPGYEATRHNYFTCNNRNRYTHLRFNIYPDGGVARLRVFGQVAPDWSKVSTSQVLDLLSMDLGGICVGYSDAHFGHPRNLTRTESPESAANGWLTARKVSRPAVIQRNTNGDLHIPGTEWCLFKLGHPGIITQVRHIACYSYDGTLYYLHLSPLLDRRDSLNLSVSHTDQLWEHQNPLTLQRKRLGQQPGRVALEKSSVPQTCPENLGTCCLP